MDCSASQFSGCERVVLQAEVSVRHQDSFKSEYERVTGARAKGESYLPTENRETRQAPILSVYFSGTDAVVGNLRALGFVVQEFQRGEFRHCVVGEKLFWCLVRNGYRLGAQAGIAPKAVKAKELVFA